jgi:hypothetical protein
MSIFTPFELDKLYDFEFEKIQDSINDENINRIADNIISKYLTRNHASVYDNISLYEKIIDNKDNQNILREKIIEKLRILQKDIETKRKEEEDIIKVSLNEEVEEDIQRINIFEDDFLDIDEKEKEKEIKKQIKIIKEEIENLLNYEFNNLIKEGIKINHENLEDTVSGIIFDAETKNLAETNNFILLYKKLGDDYVVDNEPLHAFLKTIINNELTKNLEAINDGVAVSIKKEKKKFIKKYNFLQTQYEKLINTDENKHYKWFVTVQKSDLKICNNIGIDNYYINKAKTMMKKPQGIYFSPNLRHNGTINWIDFVIEKNFEMDKYNPETSNIVAIALNKNNIYTFKNRSLIIDEPVDTGETNDAKKIFKINSIESARYMENLFKYIGYYSDVYTINWNNFYDVWNGLIIDFTAFKEDVPQWLKYDVDQLILFNNKPIEKCVVIDNKHFKDTTEPRAGAGAGAGAGADEFKKKYLKYKYKYLNLKNNK